MKLIQTADAVRYSTMTTDELRSSFLLTDLFRPGQINLSYIDLDRAVIGSAVPTDIPLILQSDEALKSSYFTERRELGILNVGAPGIVTINGERFTLSNLDGLYVGRGNEHISFESLSPDEVAVFYLLSYPAHAAYPTRLISSFEAARINIGTAETANQREITKLIHMAQGSVWNTMPPHTHMRRSEIYFYFNLAETERVIHLMGPPQETRHLVVANKQVVLSPGWSIHAGVGTSNYAFCWGMGGENQDYDDMDKIAAADLL